LTSNDPRSSSTQSLIPEERTHNDSRRKLLLVYIHGFMGAENSFRSFPAHVHNLLVITLADSHVVHTKIYPRYQSRKHIKYATEDFSKWLAPHESPTTDVVLLGHSMGGLLAAEVVLLPASSPRTGQTLRHHILGTINFDVPFLGMHPGVIKSGLGSIFNPAPPPTDKSTSLQSPTLSPQQSAASTLASTSTVSLDTLTSTMSDPLGSPEPMDQNFNPVFHNDANRPVREGWSGIFYFAMKHKDNLLKATRQLVTSHLEFGGAMADFNGLKARYSRIRALEEGEGSRRRRVVGGERTPPRVRFVNYYTASTGRPKKPKPQSGNASQEEDDKSMEIEPTISGSSLSATYTGPASLSPQISVEEDQDGQIVSQQAQSVVGSIEGLGGADNSADSSKEHDNSHRKPPDAREKATKQQSNESTNTLNEAQIDKEIEAQEQQLVQDEGSTAELACIPPDVTPLSPSSSLSGAQTHPSSDPEPPLAPSDSQDNPSASSSNKPPRDRKFCILPPKAKNAVGESQRDPTWVRVFMPGVDEVGAHCGLFFLGETYERLVGDVAGRIEGWCREEEG
ncbi:hypothetical protein EV356DRAFT_430303, partial [Viridothelium virens]